MPSTGLLIVLNVQVLSTVCVKDGILTLAYAVVSWYTTILNVVSATAWRCMVSV